MSRFLLVLYVSLMAFACTPDEENYGPRSKSPNTLPDSLATEWMYILNEGNYTWGNASVTGVNLVNGEAYQELFKVVNEIPLGDVAQSMFVRNDTGWLVVNNSGKIEVVDLPSFQRLYTIENMQSPRYIDCIGDTCYITDLYANHIYVKTCEGQEITQLKHNGLADEIKVVDNSIWVVTTPDSTSTVTSLNRYTGAFQETILEGARSVFFDNDALYWVKNEELSRRQYKLITNETLTTGLPQDLNHLVVDAIRMELYYSLNGSVWLADYRTQNADPISWYSEEGLNVYNLHFEKDESALYLVNVKDYTRRGEVIKLNSRGVEEVRIATGIIPNDIEFFHK